MELTRSYERVVPVSIRERFEWLETRNAAAVLQSTNPEAFTEVLAVLEGFVLTTADVVKGGKNKSKPAIRLDLAFRDLKWREGRHDTRVVSILRLMPYRPAGEKVAEVREVITESSPYKVDNVKDRVALDVEWHAKDGNLDRDLAAYRALYEAAIIDVGVIVTRHHASIRALAIKLGRPEGFKTTTTTNLEKLVSRLGRGDGGGCPVLVAGITDRTYDPTVVYSYPDDDVEDIEVDDVEEDDDAG